MKDFTASNLKNRVTDILNAVQMDGSARITSRTRPTMIMITEEQYNKMAFVLQTGESELLKGEIINE